ncbi:MULTISPECIES: hypothetical protein [unclassified Beijerinckia]|uniref:hypothetical protein n=1 Tax=unclassified Beijerinckia TaxID=2638183 RepID=UPI0011148B6B|nr:MULTISPECIES: hypothetical protein [unclassified Beijerinckia]MDH7795405.1 hypothetical protein [Beijerinckia sp. GAS462]
MNKRDFLRLTVTAAAALAALPVAQALAAPALSADPTPVKPLDDNVADRPAEGATESQYHHRGRHHRGRHHRRPPPRHHRHHRRWH